MSTEPPGAARGHGRAPRLTVGLPTFNGERYLRESLDALLRQSFDNFELLISDNASTDRTAEICGQYEAADPRVRYFRQPANIGSAANHNFVVREARGELFKWASDDDLYHRDLLLRCVELLDRDLGTVVAHSLDAFIDEDGRVINETDYLLDTRSPSPVRRFRSLLYGRGGNDIYGVMRTDVLRRTHMHGSYHNADRTLVAELALHGRFDHCPEVLYFRRDHPRRAERAMGQMRDRATNLDPRRGSQAKVRLKIDYVMGYVGAIRQSPLSPSDKARCYLHLSGYVLTRLLPFHEVGAMRSADPAVRDRASRSSWVRAWAKATRRPAAPVERDSRVGTAPVLGD